MIPARPITLALAIDDLSADMKSIVSYTLTEIGRRLHRHIVFLNGGEEADVVYGTAGAHPRAKLHIPFDPSCYTPQKQFEILVSRRGERLWGPKEANPDSFDLIGSIYRLLMRLDEQQVREEDRDTNGIFLTAALPQSRRAVANQPLVEQLVSALAGRLQIDISGLRHWPGNRRWAVLLTHDTDAVDLTAPMEIAYNSAKYVVRRDPLFRKLVADGLHGRNRPPEDNPLYGFPIWRETLEKRGLRSAFYLFHRTRAKRSINDCRSTVFNRPIDWAQLRSMADAGYEFGFHPPIHAKDTLDEFIESKRDIEEKLERPVFGLRHHYWALDWRNPHLTYRKHVNAGFRYDLSMAWRDAPGFRAGTCMPFRPYDPGRRRALDMYAIPTAIMDGHVISGTPTDALAAALPIINDVRENGGVLALDWHTESACDKYTYLGHRTAATKILDYIGKMNDVWFTTPWQLVQHWHSSTKQADGTR